ncbi:hypothetical protein D9757_000707 [Collybiopsis confluens]|uniref:Uncharacterized protein n=1 Tax=Collybiopsis confluens TaxID=2823264 RepID=A0A8H5MGH7_9AGAR|nr:hypothetical protein D9757_000707 [Collybiopsis confluens]
MEPEPTTLGQRKRDANVPRITYQVGSRTFIRLFREESLAEIKGVVRKKLELPKDCKLRLAHFHDGRLADLDDEDDFDVFYLAAHEKMALEVVVRREEDDISSEIAPAKPSTTDSSPSFDNQESSNALVPKKRTVTFVGEQSPDLQSVPPKKRRMSTSRPSSSHETSTAQDSPTNNNIAATSDPDPSKLLPESPVHTERPRRKLRKRAKSLGLYLEEHEGSSKPGNSSTKKRQAANALTDDEAHLEPGDNPAKKRRKANDLTELEVDPAVGIISAVESTLEVEDSSVKKAKKKVKKKNSEIIAAASPAATDSRDRNATANKPARNFRNENEAAAIQFNQDLADKITGMFFYLFCLTIINDHVCSFFPPGAAAKHVGQLATEDKGPARKRAKRRDTVTVSLNGLDERKVDGMSRYRLRDRFILISEGKATEQVADEALEKSTSKDKQGKNKNNNQASEPRLTSSQRSAVVNQIALLVKQDILAAQAAATSKSDKLNLAQRPKRTSTIHPSPSEPDSSSSTTQLNDGVDWLASKPNKIDANVTLIPASKRHRTPPSDSTEEEEYDDSGVVRRFISSENSVSSVPDAYAHIDLGELVRGPSARRLNLDSVLPAAIASTRKKDSVILEEELTIKPKSGRRSLPASALTWLDADSEDGGYDSASASDKVEADFKKTARISSLPPVLNSSIGTSKPEPASANDAIATASQTSHVGTPVAEILLPVGEDISVIHSERESSSPEKNDPIEPVVLSSPSPRSPIESAFPTTQRETRPRVKQSLISHVAAPIPRRSLRKAGSQSIMEHEADAIPRRSRRQATSQPISKHEADVRECVVRLTRSRANQMVRTPTPSSFQAPDLPPTVRVSPPPELLVSQSNQATTSDTIDDNGQENCDGSSSSVWTTLNAGSPSTADAESSRGSDELQSTPVHAVEAFHERRKELPEPLPPANPLFITSESQVDFPYSQFQDLDADTDPGAQEPPQNVSRLEEDSEEEDEVAKTITDKTSRPSSTAFRGLSQIADYKFTSSFKPPSISHKNLKENMYGQLSQAYASGSESDSGSESETETSHIPKTRRAGMR